MLAELGPGPSPSLGCGLRNTGGSGGAGCRGGTVRPLEVFAMVVALACTVQAPPSLGGVVHAALANPLPADGELPDRRALLDNA